MSGSLRLGKIFGVELRIHYSWFLIFAIISYYVYEDFRAAEYAPATSLLMGLAASAALLVCIVAHELAHSLVAMRNGIPVRSITLFLLGGVASLSREADRPRVEILMALAGPASSLGIGVACGVAWVGLGRSAEPNAFWALVSWLAQINIFLGLFNLLPGFPMDGGRVMRATIWHATRDYRKATRVASIIGQALGWIMAGGGAGIIISSLVIGEGPFDVFAGLNLVLLGWYLASIAAASYRELALRESLRGISAASAMVRDFMTVPPSMSVQQIVDSYVKTDRYRSFIVVLEGRFLGVINLENIRNVPQDRWLMIEGGSIMTRAGEVVTAAVDDDGLALARKLEEHRLDGVPVLKDGIVIGIVTRPSLARALQLQNRQRSWP